MRFVIALTLLLTVFGPTPVFAQQPVDVPELDLSGETPAPAPKKPARKRRAPPARKPPPRAPARAVQAPVAAPAVQAPAAAPAAQAPAPAPAPPAPAVDDQAGRTLEDRVNDLKEKIFRTKARLMNLQEMVVGGDIAAGARAVLLHRNEMGSSFVLESAAYVLDGAPVYTKTDRQGDLDKRDEFEIFNGHIVPGNHQVAVQYVYRGHGYGVFTYLDGYKFKVQSSYSFNAEAGKVTNVKVVGFEKGGFTADLKDRPAVRYDVDVQIEQAGKKAPPR